MDGTNARRSRYRWVVIGMLFVQMVINFIDRVNLSVAGPLIIRQFHLSPVSLGFLFSAFSIGYTVLQIPGGWLADTFGPRKVLAASVVWWSAFTALTGAAGSYLALLWTRIALGVGEGPSFTSVARLTFNWTARQERNTGMAIAFSGLLIGIAVTLPLMAFLIHVWGWRTGFYVTALLGLVWLIFWWQLVRDRPQDSRRVSASELAYIEGDEPVERSRPAPVPWRAVLRQRQTWLLPAANFANTYVTYMFSTWFPTYLVVARHFSLTQMGFWGTVPLLAGVVGVWVGGWLADTLGRRWHSIPAARRAICIGSFVLDAIFLYAGAFAASPFATIGLLAVANFFNNMVLASFFAASSEAVHGAAGTVTGFMNMGANIGGFLAPLVIGVVVAATHSYAWALATGAAAALAGAVVWIWIRPPASVPATVSA